jgi:LDH2 family malate/lactate/ureidoglycolate dehydrogenase
MAKRILPENLIKFCVEIFVKAGLSTDDACTVADVLVMTDTWGTFSHGTVAILNYVQAIKSGSIDPAGKPKLAGEGPSWAVIDANAGMGMPACCMAMNLAIEKARKQTFAWAGVRNSSHFGAAGYYANMAVKHDMIGIAMSNADPNMVVPGARGHVIGNNPIAYAVPAGKEQPIFLDIALSAVAAGKIFAAKALGHEIPSTWITDADGLPTSDPTNWPATGSMTPMAGHKGYGIALLIEVLAGALTGAGILSEVKSWKLHPGEKAYLGQSFLVINPAAILPLDDFKQHIDSAIQELHNAPKAKGSDRIYVPGELEWERREDALRNGIPLPELSFTALYQAGEELGVDTRLLD